MGLLQYSKDKIKMHKPEEQKSEGSTSSQKQNVIAKVLITVVRLAVFLLDLWNRHFDISQSTLSMLVLGGLFLFCQAIVFYRLIRKQQLKELSIPFTVGAHVFALFNVVMIGLTSPLAQAPIYDNFFFVCLGEMVNYLLAAIGVFVFLMNPLIKDSKHFLFLYEPIVNSLFYLFGAMYLGSVLDIIAFQGYAQIYFFVFTGFLIIYLLLKLAFGEALRSLSRILFVE